MSTSWTLPFSIRPQFRPQVWGGRALERVCHKPLPPTEAGWGIGESWELSAVAPFITEVAGAAQSGSSLLQLWQDHRPALVGCSRRLLDPQAEFPWLLKWLDCRDWLSVQVHPDDALAQERYRDSFGKSEAWVVVAAEPGARVVLGLKAATRRADVEQALHERRLADVLQFVPAQVGDCYWLPAGTVHAAGDGVVFAEVQRPSLRTLRLYDWDRNAAASHRPLHGAEALDAVAWGLPQGRRVVPGPAEDLAPGVSRTTLVQTNWVTISRLRIERPWTRLPTASLQAWMVLSGLLKTDDQTAAMLAVAGTTQLLPAAMDAFACTPVEGPVELLCIEDPGGTL